MKILANVVLIASLGVLATGCASPYMIDRRRDLADVFTASAGTGFGCQARASFLHLGILNQRDRWGLRGGGLISEPSEYDVFDAQFPLFITDENFFGTYSSQAEFKPAETIQLLRKKDFRWRFRFSTFPTEGGIISEEIGSWSYYTQFEVVAGVGWTVRLGFNPGELVDFILGCVALDIMDDDLEAQRLEELANPSPRCAKCDSRLSLARDGPGSWRRTDRVCLDCRQLLILGFDKELRRGSRFGGLCPKCKKFWCSTCAGYLSDTAETTRRTSKSTGDAAVSQPGQPASSDSGGKKEEGFTWTWDELDKKKPTTEKEGTGKNTPPTQGKSATTNGIPSPR